MVQRILDTVLMSSVCCKLFIVYSDRVVLYISKQLLLRSPNTVIFSEEKCIKLSIINHGPLKKLAQHIFLFFLVFSWYCQIRCKNFLFLFQATNYMHHPTGRGFRYVQSTHARVNAQAFITEGNLGKLRLGAVGESLPEKAVKQQLFRATSSVRPPWKCTFPTQTPL